MNNNDIKITFRCIEFMFYGIDITSFESVEDTKKFVNVNTKKLISRNTENTRDFLIKLDDDVKEFIGIDADYIFRSGKSYRCIFEGRNDDVIEGMTPDITVNKDLLIKTIQTIYNKNFTQYEGIDVEVLDPTIRERLSKIDVEFKRNARPTGDIVEKLAKSKTKRNFEIITAAAYKQCEPVRDMMLNYYNEDKKDFNINSLKDFEVIDDRVYIGVSEADMYRIEKKCKQDGNYFDPSNREMKYIVVSKNLYDYFFCSYGSEFQSCYSTTSTYRGWYGMLPFGTVDGHFIIYGTKEKAIKVGMTSESSKWAAPYMYFRCWGWADEANDIILDKPYTNRTGFYKAVEEVLLSKFFKVGCSSVYHSLRNSKDYTDIFSRHSLRFYPDSVRVNENFKFKLGYGNREMVGRNMPTYANNSDSSLKSELDLIKSVSDSFDPKKEYYITFEGKLVNPKKCPYTGIMIDETEDKSFYAKFLNGPLKSGEHFLAVTYCDGYAKLDATSKFFSDRSDNILTYETGRSAINGSEFALAPSFSPNPMAIKPFKEFLKGVVQTSKYSLILLRVVEGEKNTFIKYKKTGVTA